MRYFTRVQRRVRRQWRRGPGIVVALVVWLCGATGWLSFTAITSSSNVQETNEKFYNIQPPPPAVQPSDKWQQYDGQNLTLAKQPFHPRHLLQDGGDSEVTTTTEGTTTTTKKSEYPPDQFTQEQLLDGAVALYILGMVYMLFALAIVCDEFFVPSLEVISVVIDLSQDVAGATFMAAGGSMPELFTSFIAVFAAYSDVGIGTIVGSAVFNILFVIGMCAIVSKEVLVLTWWPLFRDVLFYSISLIALIIGFRDHYVSWWEALIMIFCYFLYVVFMKFNHTIEAWVKGKLKRNQLPPGRRLSIPILKGSSKFRHGVLQLMIHTIDPLGEAKVHDKALKLQAMASVNELINASDSNHNAAPPKPSGANHQNHQVSAPHDADGAATNGAVPAISNGRVLEDSHEHAPRNTSQQTTTTTTTLGSNPEDPSNPNPSSQSSPPPPSYFTYPSSQQPNGNTNGNGNGHGNGNGAIAMVTAAEEDANSPETRSQFGDDFEEAEPMDISWPDTWRKRVTYVLLAPILFSLWLTLPDVRRPEKRKWYPVTFIGSMMWIACFAYLLNWWAAVTGKAFDIPDAVMGLTFLAAGTSIPDLITSVIVAKKGYGDMAVSSSVGSNIFDVTIGLPVPWLLHGIIRGTKYRVNSDGLFCSIILLFIMLMLVIVLIASFRWKMNKSMGFVMMAMYAVFLTLALLLEYEELPCPV